MIHQLWCQHHEKYGTLFPNEPHQSCLECNFKHKFPEKVCLSQGSSFYPQTPGTAETEQNSTIKHLVLQMRNIQENGVDPLSMTRHPSTLQPKEGDRNTFRHRNQVTDSEAEPFSP